MRYLIYISILISITFSSQAQPQKASFTEILTLGDDEEASREYLFASPRLVAVDSEEKIYVADAINVEIKVFDRTGVFLNTIGGRGQGPGEFQEVTGMVLDDEDNLLVVDRFNQRATWFDSKGNVIKSVALFENQYQDFDKLFSLGSESYLLNYKVSSKKKENDLRTELFHVFDADFRTTEASFGDVNELYDMSSPFERALWGSSVNAATNGNGRIYIAPTFYEGTIYRIDASQGYTMAPLKGYNPGYASYYLLDDKEVLAQIDESKPFAGMNPNIYSLSSARHGSFSVMTQKYSVGLFILPDGRLVHFTKMGKGKNKRRYGVEVFSKEGVFEGYYPLEGYTVTNENHFIMTPLAVDNKDQFYITDNLSGFFVLRVVKLNYE